MKTIESKHGEIKVFDRMGNHTNIRQGTDVICLTKSESIDLARALIGEWQPIETCEHKKLVWMREGDVVCIGAYYGEEKTFIIDGEITKPTHYMPILKPQI